MTPTANVYIRTHQLIEQGWCQGKFASDKHNQLIDYRHDNATKFCIAGAFFRATDEQQTRLTNKDILQQGIKMLTLVGGLVSGQINRKLAGINDDPKIEKHTILKIIEETMLAELGPEAEQAIRMTQKPNHPQEEAYTLTEVLKMHELPTKKRKPTRSGSRRAHPRKSVEKPST